MRYDFVVILRRSQERKTDAWSILLCGASILFFLYFILFAQTFSWSLLLIPMAVGILLSIPLFTAKRPDKIRRYSYALFATGIGWLFMPAIPWICILFFALGLLEYQVKYPLEIGFTSQAVVINTLFKKVYAWSDFNNIVLKDGLLTLDFKSNRLFQREVLDDDEPDADEDEFNDYCKANLAKAAPAHN